MSKALQATLITIGAIVGVSALLLAGISIGQSGWLITSGSAFPMMRFVQPDSLPSTSAYGGFGPGMMQSIQPSVPESSTFGYGMMGGTGMGMMGGTGMGMMGGYANPSLLGIEPLSLDEVSEAAEDYLAGLNVEGLEVGEIMIFDNHGYAQIVETETGIGALEVLIDPVTRAVYPEHGPTMMWNLKYSPMAGFGSMGMMGMMGANRLGTGLSEGSGAELPLTPEDAQMAAQRYLDAYLPGATADDHADQFYGYYTLHIIREGEVTGMLSVNGFNGEVFLHSWHGTLLEMSDTHPD